MKTILTAFCLAVILACSAPGAGAQTATSTDATPLFAITYRAGPAWKPGVRMEDQGLRAHFFYWKDLHVKGRVFVAGPVGPDGGLVLLRAADATEAAAVMEADPAVTARIFVGEVRPFTARFKG